MAWAALFGIVRHQVGLQVTCLSGGTRTVFSAPVSALRNRAGWAPGAVTSQGQADSAQAPGTTRTVTGPPASGIERSSVCSAAPARVPAHTSRSPTTWTSYPDPEKPGAPTSAVSCRAGPPARGAVHSVVVARPSASVLVCIQYTSVADAVIPSSEPASATACACRIRGGPVAGTRARSLCAPSAPAIMPIDVPASSTSTGVYVAPSGKVPGIGNDRAPGQTVASVAGPPAPREAAGACRRAAGSASTSAMTATAAPIPSKPRQRLMTVGML